MSKETIRITYREALKQAIREALLGDERVFLLGEDVGRYGGAFAVSGKAQRRCLPGGFGSGLRRTGKPTIG